MFRNATFTDLEKITEIYNQAIASKKSTSDMQPFTAKQREGWFFEHNGNKRTPIYVYEEDGAVVGYCYLSAYRPGRQALEGIAEVSYYVDFKYHRKGIGIKLLQYSIYEAKKLGYKNLFAIVISSNDGSVVLLKKCGFKLWGVLPDIVYIDNKIYSHFYYGLNLYL